MEDKIKNVLNELKPYLNSDGGDVEFIKYENNHVYIKLTGACQNCVHKDQTIKNGIYESLRSEIPEIQGIINVEV